MASLVSTLLPAALARERWQPLALTALAIAALIVLPIAVVVGSLASPSVDTWRHLAATVLGDYIVNTLLLLAGVVAGVLLIGVGAAWLTASFRFPGHAVLDWALILPLAMPAYVIAYAYTDALQFAGPVQTWLRGMTGWKARQYWFPEVRSLPGAVALLALVLYPYVYLTARAAFLEQPLSALEVARLAGQSGWQRFLRVTLPLARPGIAAGAALAAMETLADFGTVDYFAVPTFSTGIYRTWFSLGDLRAAAQLSVLMLGFVVAIVAIERAGRGRARVHVRGGRKVPPVALTGVRAWLATGACAVPVALGFAIPAGMLFNMALAEGDPQFGARFFALVANSFSLAAIAALITVALAVLVAFAQRGARGPVVRWASRAAGLGYALPGTVIAVGAMIPLGALDRAFAGWAQAAFGVAPGLILTGTIAALVYAYAVRFLGVALQTVSAGLARVTPSMEDAARSLGAPPGETLRRVHLPLVRASALTAALIVFVDVMKELPATLVLRPFNFDTLAVQAYNLAADERLAEAATASLVIVAVGLLPVILLARAVRHGAASPASG